MKWIKTSEQLPPIGQPVMTCRFASDYQDESDPYQQVEIMSLNRKVKKTGREDWITWNSLNHIVYTKEDERPEYWMPFPALPDR